MKIFQAMRDEVAVKRILQDRQGKIIIPKEAQIYKQYHGMVVGEVISIGPKYPYKDELKVGDNIIYRRHEGKGQRLKLKDNEGNLIVILRERFVLAVIRE